MVLKDSKPPLSKGLVTLHASGAFPYRNRTGDAGVARVSVPEGEYHVCATNGGYKNFMMLAEIVSDTAVEAELWPGSDLDDILG